ncbi:protein LDOC1-like [Garra rufa]|uniref:protein LDOC1-like n=1 Tax=Garra rufa TaxID=137080 RepID=UPI003CCEB8C8
MEIDPAEEQTPTSNVDRILSELSSQAAAIHKHEQILTEILQHLRPQASPVSSIQSVSETALLQPTQSQVVFQPGPPAGLLPEPKLPAPERYDGNPERCRGFITQCTLAFQLQPNSFPTESSKVAYMTTLLVGKALDWATALWDRQSPLTTSSKHFIAEMKKVFHHPVSGAEVDNRLLQLTQGTRSVAEFAIEFRTLATEN